MKISFISAVQGFLIFLSLLFWGCGDSTEKFAKPNPPEVKSLTEPSVQKSEKITEEKKGSNPSIRIKKVFEKPDEIKVERYGGSGDWKIKYQTPYLKGKRHGVHKYFDKSGNLRETIEYRNGKKDGEAKYFFENGKPHRYHLFSNGKKIGVHKWFHKTGQVQEQHYENGFLAMLKFFDESERLVGSRTFADRTIGSPELGSSKCYGPKGNLTSEKIADEKAGTITYIRYDASGELNRKAIYNRSEKTSKVIYDKAKGVDLR